MSEITTKFAPILLEEINKSKRILLHCHPSPDPDSVGTSLAMKLALESLNKNVTLIQGDSDIPKAFDFPGVQTIVPKSYFDIDLSEFDLFIVLDSSSKGMISNKAEINFPNNLKVIAIDHHKSNELYGHINIVDSNYSSCAELLYDLLTEMGVSMNHDIALNLFMGMYADTGGFKYGNVTSKTFETLSQLVKLAPDYPKTIFTMENSNRKQKLVYEGLLLSSLKEYCNGKVAICSISNDKIISNGISKSDMSGSIISNQIKSVIDYDIGITAIEDEPNIVKISMRTRDSAKFDLSKLAVALGGGGHMAAAGARLNMTIDEAIDKVVQNIKLIYNL